MNIVRKFVALVCLGTLLAGGYLGYHFGDDWSGPAALFFYMAAALIEVYFFLFVLYVVGLIVIRDKTLNEALPETNGTAIVIVLVVMLGLYQHREVLAKIDPWHYPISAGHLNK